MSEKELVNRLSKNYDYKSQKWIYKNIPDEVLDCVIDIMKKEDDFAYLYSKIDSGNVDFIVEFIYDKIVGGKQGEITKLWLKGCFKESTQNLFD